MPGHICTTQPHRGQSLRSFRVVRRREHGNVIRNSTRTIKNITEEGSMKRINIGFMASHGGSNMQAVLDAINNGQLPANPCLLISNNSKSTAIERAENQGMPFAHISQATHPDIDDHDLVILRTLEDHNVEYILLVGYMKKLGVRTLQEYKGRIINIHPSLLPKYGGKGMYGRFVHEEVLKNNEQETGVTIHLVDEEYDTGRSKKQ